MPKLPAVATPSPPAELIPTFLAIGTKDGMVVGGLSPDPNIIGGELPLDPAAFLAIGDSDPNSLANALGAYLDVLHLANDPADFQPDLAYTDPNSTLLIGATPQAGNISRNSFQLALWDELRHRYANGFDTRSNPKGFGAARTFWEFFKLNPK